MLGHFSVDTFVLIPANHPYIQVPISTAVIEPLIIPEVMAFLFIGLLFPQIQEKMPNEK